MANWIIVVDDDTTNLKAAGKILSQRGFRVTALKSGRAMLDYLAENGTPELILLDIMMPDMDGFDTLEALRAWEAEGNRSETPVIFLTSEEDSDIETRGFEMGVSDFIRKPFDPEVLMKRLEKVIGTKEKIERIEEDAQTDAMTGFYNKAATRERLEQICQKEIGCLLMIDLDSFKSINDIYGHDMGDRILISFSEIIKNNVPNGSLCGRIGGDEFLVFAKGLINETEIKAFTVKLNESIMAEAKKLFGEGFLVPLGASVGAVLVPEQGTSFSDLFHMADTALYDVKGEGKHNYSLYRKGVSNVTDAKDMEMNLKTLSSLLEERSIPNSVMWMGQEAFGIIYRYMMRYMGRYNVSGFKVLINVEVADTVPSEDVLRIIEEVKILLQGSLRNSDVMMQTGKDQFFILLPELDADHIDVVIDRMLKGWSEHEDGDKAKLNYEVDMVFESNKPKQDADEPDWVVVVDDDKVNLQRAGHILSQNGIRATALTSGQALLDFMKENRPSLILLDYRMPDMDGFETLRKLRTMEAEEAEVPVIFLTGDDDEDTEVEGLKLGAMDFIKKPFTPEVLLLRVRHSIELIRLQSNLSAEVEKKTEENEKLFIHVVASLATAIDAKDTYTNGHSSRVATYAREIASRHGYSSKAQSDIYMMGLLHDVGKIGIPDAVINKPGKLTNEEFDMIKTHPVMGAKILSNIQEMPELATGAKWHHERYGGGGYPDGLAGEAIPEQARIIAVADAYDAMSSRRSYRDVLPQEKVREQIESGIGTQFDPTFARIMLNMIDEDTEYKMREV